MNKLGSWLADFLKGYGCMCVHLFHRNNYTASNWNFVQTNVAANGSFIWTPTPIWTYNIFFSFQNSSACFNTNLSSRIWILYLWDTSKHTHRVSIATESIHRNLFCRRIPSAALTRCLSSSPWRNHPSPTAFGKCCPSSALLEPPNFQNSLFKRAEK